MTQEFIGTQQVTAWSGEQDGVLGHYVKTADGVVTWMAQAAFDAVYLPLGHIGALAMHEQRVVGEKAQLDDRMRKLAAFIDGELYKALGILAQQRLRIQLEAMSLYAAVLADRIRDFTPRA